MQPKISAKIGLEKTHPKLAFYAKLSTFGLQFWTHLAGTFPGGTVFFGTLCATPSLGVPWGHLGVNFDGFEEH